MIPKFRAWLIKQKKMVDIIDIGFEDRFIAYRIKRGMVNKADFDEIVLMFSGGTKDMNNYEIFEGDIVSTFINGYPVIAEVVFIDGCFFMRPFCIPEGSGISTTTYYGFSSNGDNKCETMLVIGNIYENPELLKKEVRGMYSIGLEVVKVFADERGDTDWFDMFVSYGDPVFFETDMDIEGVADSLVDELEDGIDELVKEIAQSTEIRDNQQFFAALFIVDRKTGKVVKKILNYFNDGIRNCNIPYETDQYETILIEPLYPKIFKSFDDLVSYIRGLLEDEEYCGHIWKKYKE